MEKVKIRKVDYRRSFNWFSQGQQVVREDLKFWFISSFCILTATLLLSEIPKAGGFISNVFAAYMGIGNLLVAKKKINYEETSYRDFIRPLTGAHLVLFQVIIVANLANLGLDFGSEYMKVIQPNSSPNPLKESDVVTNLPSILSFVGMILLGMAQGFSTPLAYFKNCSMMEAFSLSFRACITNWLTLLVSGVLMITAVIIGAMCLLVGLFVALPIVTVMGYLSFSEIFSHEESQQTSDDTDGV